MAGYQWRWRGGRGPGRPMKPRTIGKQPIITRFVPVIPPEKVDSHGKEPIVMSQDEFEALRLIDYLGLLQEEASKQMGISRGTVWRCLDSARRKVAAMLAEGRELTIAT
ncbi:DUF134 domain-containing protein [Candidatus Hecatella orcuttiae]|uniref:DUF134 domain-containing protein n=1 Tax=Candidatus Hecatella orcuttiae TaxID=1935119 RepID=UPI0031840F84